MPELLIAQLEKQQWVALVPASYLAAYRLSALMNGQAVGSAFVFDAATGKASYAPASRLPEGGNTFSAQARDYFGHLSNRVSAAFTIDTIVPAIRVSAPQDGALTNQPAQTLKGSVSEPATVTVNGAAVTLASDLSFSIAITLREGANVISVQATDLAGNSATRSLILTLDTAAPAAIVTSGLTVTSASANTIAISAPAGSVEASAHVRITNLASGATVEVEGTLQP